MSHCKENIKRLSQLSERKGRKRSNNAMTVEEIREKLKTSEYEFRMFVNEKVVTGKIEKEN